MLKSHVRGVPSKLKHTGSPNCVFINRAHHHAVANERPSGLIASKGIELLTFGTPNGQSELPLSKFIC